MHEILFWVGGARGCGWSVGRGMGLMGLRVANGESLSLQWKNYHVSSRYNFLCVACGIR